MKLVLLVTLVAVAFAGSKFKLTVSTKNADYAQSEGPFYASVIDYTGQEVDLGKIKTSYFSRGKTVVSEVHSDVTFKKVGCLTIRSGTTDAWLFDKVSISTDTDPGFHASNTKKFWFSTDTSTKGDKGKLAYMWCAPPYPSKE